MCIYQYIGSQFHMFNLLFGFNFPNSSGKFKDGLLKYQPLDRNDLQDIPQDERARDIQKKAVNSAVEMSDEKLRLLLSRADLYRYWVDSNINQLANQSKSGKSNFVRLH